MSFFINRCKYVIAFFIAVLTLCVSTTVQAATLRQFVDDGHALGGDGLSWGSAFRYLQDAVEAAIIHVQASQDNDAEIWVAQGVYRPDLAETFTLPTNARERCFEIPKNVRLYGGFFGNESNDQTGFLSRAPVSRITVLTGDIGTANDASDNSFHIIRMNQVIDTVILDGFVIGGGNSIDESSQPGAVDFQAGSGLSLLGDGQSTSTSVGPYIVRCTFGENRGKRGGAVFMQGGEHNNPKFYSCKFIQNHAGVIDEQSPVFGIGGAFCSEDQRTIVEDIVGATPLFINCLFYDNDAENSGGAAYFDPLTGPSFVNCTIADNVALVDAGGVYHEDPHVCGDPNFEMGSASFRNCIIWGNDCVDCQVAGRDQIDGARYLFHTTIQDLSQLPGSCGQGDPSLQNLESDPLFVDAPNNDFRLQCGSPAIDTAYPNLSNMLDGYTVNMNQLVTLPSNLLMPDAGGKQRAVGNELSNVIAVEKLDRGALETQSSQGCSGDVFPFACGDSMVNIDDLVVVITNWGACPALPYSCQGDTVYPGVVDIDDLVAVITHWGACGGGGGGGSIPTSFQDCWDDCSANFEPGSEKWHECMDACIQGLCRLGYTQYCP